MKPESWSPARMGAVCVALFAPLLTAHCGETSADQNGAGGSAGAVAGGGTAGGSGQPAWDGSADADADHPTLNIGDVSPGYDGPEYDGDQSCAPDATGFGAYVSCCEGMPCEGECHLLNDKWQCDCNGIAGGCEQYGMHCCQGGCQAFCPGGPGK